jgi:hypothetical protein
LSSPRFLRFPGHAPIPNPFHGVHILKRYPYDATKSLDDQARCARSGVRKGLRTVSMELWLVEPQPRLLQIKQIAKVCSVIREALGDNVEWIVDASHESIPSIISSFPLVQERLLQRFRTVPAERSAFIAQLQASNPVQWTPIICDASLNDPGDLNRFVYEKSNRQLGFDKDPTGRVFRDGYPDQITLKGAVQKRDNDMYYLTEEFGELNYRLMTHSLSAMMREINFVMEEERTEVRTHEEVVRLIARCMAKKRSGDWGQVENCVVKGRVFITCDKMAALYAVYRDVPVVYVQSAQHTGVLQLTLTLVNKKASTASVGASPVRQSGGGNRVRMRNLWYARRDYTSY